MPSNMKVLMGESPAHIPKRSFRASREPGCLPWLLALALCEVCPAGLRLCREGPFTATGVCLCCCLRPFSSRTEPGFFSGPCAEWRARCVPWPNQTLLPSCVPSPARLFLPFPPLRQREAAPWAPCRSAQPQRKPPSPLLPHLTSVHLLYNRINVTANVDEFSCTNANSHRLL